MRDTLILIAKGLQKNLIKIKDLNPKESLIFLPEFIEQIFIAKSMITIIKENKEEVADDFVNKLTILIQNSWAPNGWEIEEKLSWGHISKQDVNDWINNKTNGNPPAGFHENLEDILHLRMTDTYKVLSAIIKEAEETE